MVCILAYQPLIHIVTNFLFKMSYVKVLTMKLNNRTSVLIVVVVILVVTLWIKNISNKNTTEVSIPSLANEESLNYKDKYELDLKSYNEYWDKTETPEIVKCQSMEMTMQTVTSLSFTKKTESITPLIPNYGEEKQTYYCELKGISKANNRHELEQLVRKYFDDNHWLSYPFVAADCR